jgi:hypothetical protein
MCAPSTNISLRILCNCWLCAVGAQPLLDENAMLTDNWDDHEGYYRTRSGELLNDRCVCSLGLKQTRAAGNPTPYFPFGRGFGSC